MKMMGRMSEGLSERRAELMEQAEAGREELARRAEQIREQFAENVTQEAITSFTGWTLVSTGIAWGVTDWMRGRRGFNSMIVPLALLALGMAVLGGGSMWHRRAITIGEAEERVREELAQLGPFARTRVLRDVAEASVPFVHRITSHN